MASPNAYVSEKSIDVQVLYSDEPFVTALPVAGQSGVGASSSVRLPSIASSSEDEDEDICSCNSQTYWVIWPTN